MTTTFSYNAANQRTDFTYDGAGNLTSDGTTTYAYDALGRMVIQGTTTNAYTGDGVLVQRGSTRYAVDTVSGLSQILSDGTSDYLYGSGRLASSNAGTRVWHLGDALGSVRQTLDGTGAALGSTSYDPWGAVQSGTVPTFGFTGELQTDGLVHLRARWYNAGQGTLLGRDPFAGWSERPDSLHPYVYAGNDPVRFTDPTGKTWYLNNAEAARFEQDLDAAIIGNPATSITAWAGATGVAQAWIVRMIDKTAGFKGATVPASTAFGIIGGVFGLTAVCAEYHQSRLIRMRSLISKTRDDPAPPHPNATATGIALMYVPEGILGGTLYALNRSNGSTYALGLEWAVTRGFHQSLQPQWVATNNDDVLQGFHFDDKLPLSVLFPQVRQARGGLTGVH